MRTTEHLCKALFGSLLRNPNGEGLPHWPEYDKKESYLQIGATTQQAQKLKDKEAAFWTSLRATEVEEATKGDTQT